MPRQHENDPHMTTIQEQLYQMSHVIGGLQNAVTIMTDVWKTQEERATAGRALVHQKIDVLRQEVVQLAGRVDKIAVDLAAVQPSVKAFNDDKLRSEGAKRLGARLWAAMTAATAALGWGAHELFSNWKH